MNLYHATPHLHIEKPDLTMESRKLRPSGLPLTVSAGAGDETDRVPSERPPPNADLSEICPRLNPESLL